MFNNHLNGNTAINENFNDSFNGVTEFVYCTTSPDALPVFHTHCLALEQLAEEHPHHPAVAALVTEHIPLLVCATDYVTKKAQRTATADALVHNKQQRLLQLINTWSTGWLKAYLPADCKVPDALISSERPVMEEQYKTIESLFTESGFKLPAAMALEVILIIIEAPAEQAITYSQWHYAQLLLTQIQQALNNPVIPATEEHIIETLLALRCNTAQFSIWYTQHLKHQIQAAGSMAEKKSD